MGLNSADKVLIKAVMDNFERMADALESIAESLKTVEVENEKEDGQG